MHGALRSPTSALHPIAFVVGVVLLLSPDALAQRLDVGGVTFEPPAGLVPEKDPPPPIIVGWRNAESTLTVAMLLFAKGAADAELDEWPGDDWLGIGSRLRDDWPGAGHALADEVGKAAAKGMQSGYGVPCRFEGVPVQRDLERSAMRVQVDTTCSTAPQPVSVRTRILQVLHPGG